MYHMQYFEGIYRCLSSFEYHTCNSSLYMYVLGNKTGTGVYTYIWWGVARGVARLTLEPEEQSE